MKTLKEGERIHWNRFHRTRLLSNRFENECKYPFFNVFTMLTRPQTHLFRESKYQSNQKYEIFKQTFSTFFCYLCSCLFFSLNS